MSAYGRLPGDRSCCCRDVQVTICRDAAARTARRMPRRRDRITQPAGRPQDQSLAAGSRHRHHVRQRRQFGRAARRTGCPASRRRPQVRARAGARRRGSAARPVDATAHARASPPGRAHRRQPAAVDDGAVQRRLPGGRRWLARGAGLPWLRLADQHGAGESCAPSTATARRRAARWRSTPARRQGGSFVGSGCRRP